jgi:hypothetical protein
MPWRIFQDRAGRWRWEVIDSRAAVITRAAHTFATHAECLKDAYKYGFVSERAPPTDLGAEPD